MSTTYKNTSSASNLSLEVIEQAIKQIESMPPIPTAIYLGVVQRNELLRQTQVIQDKIPWQTGIQIIPVNKISLVAYEWAKNDYTDGPHCEIKVFGDWRDEYFVELDRQKQEQAALSLFKMECMGFFKRGSDLDVVCGT